MSHRHLVLFDGKCGLCSRTNRFIWDRDSEGRFAFAPLQEETARKILTQHGRDPGDRSTFVVVADHGGPLERVLTRSEAALFVLNEIGGPWRAVRALMLLLVPRRWRDAAYDFVARNRFRWFGRIPT